MREIPLTQGKVALVDDQDFDAVSQFKWYAYKPKAGATWYARRNILTETGRGAMQMHRFVLGLSPGELFGDHKDGDGLNNQRENLRAATKGGNASNSHVRLDNHTGFKGVGIDKRRSKNFWTAQIAGGGKRQWIGYFPTAEAAARAYDEYAHKFHGEFARLNFPEDVLPYNAGLLSCLT